MEKFSTSLRGYKKEEVNKFVDDCIALTVIVLMQEGKSAGLGSLKGELILWQEFLENYFQKNNVNYLH